MQVKRQQLTGETGKAVEVTVDWNDPTVDRRNLWAQLSQRGSGVSLFFGEEDALLIADFLERTGLEDNPHLMNLSGGKLVVSMEFRALSVDDNAWSRNPNIIVPLKLDDGTEYSLNLGNGYSSTDYVDFFDKNLLIATPEEQREVAAYLLEIIRQTTTITEELSEPLGILQDVDRKNTEADYKAKLAEARNAVVSAQNKLSLALKKLQQTPKTASIDNLENRQQLANGIQEVLVLVEGTVYRFDNQLPSPGLQLWNLQSLFENHAQRPNDLTQAMGHLKNQPDMEGQYQVLLKYYEDVSEYLEAANGEGWDSSVSVWEAEGKVYDLYTGVGQMPPDSLLKRAKEITAAATQLARLYPVARAQAQAGALMRELAYKEGTKAPANGEEQPKFDLAGEVEELLSLYREAADRVGNELTETMVKHLVWSLKVHVTTGPIASFLEEKAGVSLKDFSNKDKEIALEDLKDELARKDQVTNELAALRAEQEKKPSLTTRLVNGLKSVFRSDEQSTLLGRIATLDAELQELTRHADLATQAIFFLEDSSGGYDQLEKLQQEVANIKTALSSIPPRQSGEPPAP